jgi:hypothetical protein
MLSATELRIGNLVNYDTSEGDVLTATIDWEDLKWLSEDEQGFNLVHNPIPLTEEWLLKFGFKIYKDPETVFYEIRFDKIANYKFYISRKIGFGIFYYENDFLITQIDSVHQLQNLFYSLTNEELTLIK